MDINIKKAKLAKGGQVESTYIDPEENEITIKGKNICHHDLIVSISRLVPFFADLTEQKEAASIDWDDIECETNIDLLRKLDVTGVSMGGDSNNRIVTLTGKRTLMSSKILNLNSPGVEMDSDSDWEQLGEFDIAVRNFFYEVEQYILNRKWRVQQTEINFEEGDDPFASAPETDDAPPIEEAINDVA